MYVGGVDGGGGVSDTSSNEWALKAARVLILVLAMSHIFSIDAQKYGVEFTQSFGRAKGDQIKGSSQSFVGGTTPSLVMSSGSIHKR
jgi:hypothetical protein